MAYKILLFVRMYWELPSYLCTNFLDRTMYKHTLCYIVSVNIICYVFALIDAQGGGYINCFAFLICRNGVTS